MSAFGRPPLGTGREVTMDPHKRDLPNLEGMWWVFTLLELLRRACATPRNVMLSSLVILVIACGGWCLLYGWHWLPSTAALVGFVLACAIYWITESFSGFPG